ncbi:MAG: ATP-binding protein [Pseudomonadota bacterium]
MSRKEQAAGQSAIATKNNASEELQNFVYTVSHDFHAPIRHIKSFLQILVEDHSGSLDEDAQECIAYAIGGAERLQRMLDDLVTFSRVETHAISNERIELGALVRNVVAKTAPDATVGYSESLPFVSGASEQLYALFEQLISNAVDHNSNPQPCIDIRASVDGDFHAIDVSDNGEHVAEVHHDRVFQLFHRLEGKSNVHTGAGLAIARRIAQRHGGELNWAPSTTDGNCIRLKLPINP